MWPKVIFTLCCLLIASCYGTEENCVSTSTNGKIKLHPFDDNSVGFDVLCDQLTDGGGWTVVLNRDDGGVNFNNRTWVEYKHGFGTFDDEFFLGLDKLNALTASSRHELQFVMVDFKNNTHVANYGHVKFLDSSELYVVAALGNYTGDAGNDFVADGFCSVDKYCEGRVPGWNKDKSSEHESFIFAEHPYNANLLDSNRTKDKKSKDEKSKDEKSKSKNKTSKDDAPKDSESVEEDDEQMMARSATIKGGRTPVMCWRQKSGGECEPLRTLKMLVRPVNAYLHVAPL